MCMYLPIVLLDSYYAFPRISIVQESVAPVIVICSSIGVFDLRDEVLPTYIIIIIIRLVCAH